MQGITDMGIMIQVNNDEKIYYFGYLGLRDTK